MNLAQGNWPRKEVGGLVCDGHSSRADRRGPGSLDTSQAETSYIQRFNGTVRQWCRRLTGKTYAFPKKCGMLEAELALEFARYSSCRIHKTLWVMPAM